MISSCSRSRWSRNSTKPSGAKSSAPMCRSEMTAMRMGYHTSGSLHEGSGWPAVPCASAPGRRYSVPDPAMPPIANLARRMSRRDALRALLALGAGVAVALRVVPAQGQSKMRRIGFLTPRSRPTPPNTDAFSEAFTQGMRELGYVEGRNVVIEWRYADGRYQSLPELAAEL